MRQAAALRKTARKGDPDEAEDIKGVKKDDGESENEGSEQEDGTSKYETVQELIRGVRFKLERLGKYHPTPIKYDLENLRSNSLKTGNIIIIFDLHSPGPKNIMATSQYLTILNYIDSNCNSGNSPTCEEWVCSQREELESPKPDMGLRSSFFDLNQYCFGLESTLLVL